MIQDWIGVGHWLPSRPYKPIGLLRAILAWHGSDNLDDRPAAADMARDAELLAADRARIAMQMAERAQYARARAAGQAALGGPGHTAARDAVAAATRRALQRRTLAAAEDVERMEAAIRAARGNPPHEMEAKYV